MRALTRIVGPVFAIVMAAALAGVSVDWAAFWGTTNNTGNSATAASYFPLPYAYAGIGNWASRTGSGTLTVTYPPAVQVNDLLLLVQVNAANQNIATPSGWTQIADAATSSPSQMRFTVWWRAAAGESSVDLSVNTNSNGTSALVLHYRRIRSTATPPSVASVSIPAGSSGTAISFTPSPDLTTNAVYGQVVSLVAIRDGNTLSLSTPRSFTLRATSVQNTTGQARALGVADQLMPVNPSTPASPTWSQSGTAAQWMFATLAFA